MFCTNCGKRIPSDSRRCPACGADLTYENNVIRNRPDPDKNKKKKPKHTAGIIFALVAVLALLECAWVFVLSPRKLEKKSTDTYTQAAANAKKATSDTEGLVTAAPTSDPAMPGAPTSSTPSNPEKGVITPTPNAAKPTPTPTPTVTPTPIPTVTPSPVPTKAPTPEPTRVPTPEPTRVPTPEPTRVPTPEPTAVPTPVQEEPVWNEEETWITDTGDDGDLIREVDNETGLIYDDVFETGGTYLLPTDSERIDSGDLAGISDEGLRIARNEIYARHGLIFRSDDLNEYFSGQPWYHGTETDADAIVLTPLEQENLETIIAYEELKGNSQDAEAEEETDAEDTFVTFEEDRADELEAEAGLTDELVVEEDPADDFLFDEEADEDFFLEEADDEEFFTDEELRGEDSFEELITDEYSENDWILPDSSKKKLKSSDLQSLSAKDLRLARNEIYARHGLIFHSEDLAEYFSGKEWYEGTVENEDEIKLSETEQKNITLIKKYEKKKASE